MRQNLDVSIASNFTFFRQYKNVAGKANRMLGFINKNLSSKNTDKFLSLHISLVRSHLEYVVQLWSPHHTKDSKIRSYSAKGYGDDYITMQ